MKKIGTYLLGFGLMSVAFMLICAVFLYVDTDYSKKILPASAQSERLVIVIDPGHGGEDGGCVSTEGVLEKDLNLLVSEKVKGILAASGYEILMTRNEDKMVYDMYGDMEDYTGKKKLFDLKNRIKFTRESNADVFVSIHMNKFPQEKYSGLQVYYSPNNGNSRLLAEAVKRTNAQYLQRENEREIKESGSNIFVLNRLEVPAVLIECGFLSNQAEAQLLCEDEYRGKLALVIAASVMGYNES